MKTEILLLLGLAFASCKTDGKKLDAESSELLNKTSEIAVIESFNYDGLELLLHKKDEKTYVVNFWATWCKPCVKELPAFEKLFKNYADKNVEIILVSLDFPNQIESRLLPFIEKHKLQSRVVHMNDPDQNTWIPKVSEKWSGTIPATLIYNTNNREFYEQSFTFDLLQSELKKFLKQH